MIAHRVHDDGVLVTLKQSWGTAFATLTESQLKRFAWSVLADLDPDGVERLARGSAHKAGCATGKLAAPRAAPPPRVLSLPPAPFSKACDAQMIALYREGVNYEAIGKSMNPPRTRGSISGRINRLRDAGVIK